MMQSATVETRQRLDAFAFASFASAISSRRQARSIAASGALRVNGDTPRGVRCWLEPGDRVELSVGASAGPGAHANSSAEEEETGTLA